MYYSPHTQESQQNSSKRNMESVDHGVWKVLENSNHEKNLKISHRKRAFRYKGINIRLEAEFLLKTMQERKELSNIFRVLKGKESFFHTYKSWNKSSQSDPHYNKSQRTWGRS